MLKVTKLVRGKAKIHTETLRRGHVSALSCVNSHDEGHGPWGWEQKIDLRLGRADTGQPGTTQRQMSESEALGTEEAVTKRAEASFKSGGGRKEREDCNFRGTMGKLLTFRIREAGSMEVKRRTKGRRGDTQAPPGWEGGRRLGCSAGQMERGKPWKAERQGGQGERQNPWPWGRKGK